MTEATKNQRCRYTRLENGIHEFVFLESSREAIEAFFQQLEVIIAGSTPDEIARYLVDVTQGDKEVSIVSMAQRFRKLEAQFPRRARGRTVILHKPGLLISFIDNFIRALAPGRDVTRFFPVEERDAAIQWLLSQQ